MSYNPREAYRSVRLNKGHLVARIKNITQSKWTKVCENLGLFVSKEYGKGGHYSVYRSKECSPEYTNDSSCLVLTIQKDQYPEIQRDNVKKIVAYGAYSKLYTEEDVWKALGIQ